MEQPRRSADTAPAPRWVKLAGVAVAVAIAIAAALHLVVAWW